MFRPSEVLMRTFSQLLGSRGSRRTPFSALIGASVLSAALVGVPGVLATGHSTAKQLGAGKATAPTGGSVCPRHSIPLPANGLAGATEAALRDAPRLFLGTKLAGIRAVQATRADADRARGGYAKTKCGRAIQSRTIDVYLEFPAQKPSASLSQGVVVVTRTSGGYVTWARLH